MQNLQAIRERRNNAVQKADDIEARAKAEERNLTVDEIGQISDFVDEADAQTKLLATERKKRGLKENKLDDESDEAEQRSGGKKLSKKQREVRALNSYIKRGSAKELREIDPSLSTVEGGVLAPESVDGDIIKKLTETAPIVKAVRSLPSTTGNLKIVRENTTDEAGFIGEAKEVPKTKHEFKHVDLNTKRVGARTQLTNEMIVDSAANLVDYAVDRLGRDMGKTLERGILAGNNPTYSTESFKPIIGDSDVKTVDLTSGNLTVEKMLKLYTAVNPQFLDNSMFVVSRAAFDEIAKLQDGDNRYLVFTGNVEGRPGFEFKGVPVYVSSILDDKSVGADIVLGDFNAGYGLVQKQGMTINHVTGDSRQVLTNGHLIVVSGMFDGAVINPDAFVTAKLKK